MSSLHDARNSEDADDRRFLRRFSQISGNLRGDQRGSASYLLIGIWLAGLMLLGVILSELSGHWLPLPRWGIVALVLGLSTIKAALVALYYMHLQSDRKLLALVAVAPFVLILLALSVVFSSHFVRL